MAVDKLVDYSLMVIDHIVMTLIVFGKLKNIYCMDYIDRLMFFMLFIILNDPITLLEWAMNGNISLLSASCMHRNTCNGRKICIRFFAYFLLFVTPVMI